MFINRRKDKPAVVFQIMGYSSMKRDKLLLPEVNFKMKENLHKEYGLMSPLIWHSRTSKSNLWCWEIRMLLASWGGGAGTHWEVAWGNILGDGKCSTYWLGYTGVQLCVLCISLYMNFFTSKKEHEVWIIINDIYVWEFRMKCTDVCDLIGYASKIRCMDRRSTDMG